MLVEDREMMIQNKSNIQTKRGVTLGSFPPAAVLVAPFDGA